MIGQAEQPIRDLIIRLRANLAENLEILAEFPDASVFGINEIHANTKNSIRYIDKLNNRYMCTICGNEHGDKPTVQYFKALYHHDCFIERHGQEKFDTLVEAQRKFREENPDYKTWPVP